MKSRILGLLGLCNKAKALVYGFDAVVKKAKEKKLCLILIANDFSFKSLKNLKEKLINVDAQIIILKSVSMCDMYHVLKKRTGVILINQVNFENGIRKLLSLNY